MDRLTIGSNRSLGVAVSGTSHRRAVAGVVDTVGALFNPAYRSDNAFHNRNIDAVTERIVRNYKRFAVTL
jgi:hypothetical protein